MYRTNSNFVFSSVLALAIGLLLPISAQADRGGSRESGNTDKVTDSRSQPRTPDKSDKVERVDNSNKTIEKDKTTNNQSERVRNRETDNNNKRVESNNRVENNIQVNNNRVNINRNQVINTPINNSNTQVKREEPRRETGSAYINRNRPDNPVVVEKSTERSRPRIENNSNIRISDNNRDATNDRTRPKGDEGPAINNNNSNRTIVKDKNVNRDLNNNRERVIINRDQVNNNNSVTNNREQVTNNRDQVNINNRVTNNRNLITYNRDQVINRERVTNISDKDKNQDSVTNNRDKDKNLDKSKDNNRDSVANNRDKSKDKSNNNWNRNFDYRVKNDNKAGHFANDSWYKSRTTPNAQSSYDKRYTEKPLPRNYGSGLPFLIKRNQELRSGYYRHHHQDYGYYSPSWRWSHYFFEPIINRCLFSPFYYYINVPPYLSIDDVYYSRPITIIYVERTIEYRYFNDDSYYLARKTTRSNALYNAISDIQKAWENNDFKSFARHLDNNSKVAIYLDGEYAYSLSANDYAEMSQDAIENIDTESFTINRVTQRDNGQYVLYGTHIYRLDDSDTRTVYVSFTIEKDGNNYYIVEAGSSSTKLRY